MPLQLLFGSVSFSLTPGRRLRIGRSDTCDVVIAGDPLVSSQHCSVTEAGLHDAGSTNGTKLNAAAIPQKQNIPLKPGDVVTVGETNLFIEEAVEGQDGGAGILNLEQDDNIDFSSTVHSTTEWHAALETSKASSLGNGEPSLSFDDDQTSADGAGDDDASGPSFSFSYAEATPSPPVASTSSPSRPLPPQRAGISSSLGQGLNTSTSTDAAALQEEITALKQALTKSELKVMALERKKHQSLRGSSAASLLDQKKVIENLELQIQSFEFQLLYGDEVTQQAQQHNQMLRSTPGDHTAVVAALSTPVSEHAAHLRAIAAEMRKTGGAGGIFSTPSPTSSSSSADNISATPVNNAFTESPLLSTPYDPAWAYASSPLNGSSSKPPSLSGPLITSAAATAQLMEQLTQLKTDIAALHAQVREHQAAAATTAAVQPVSTPSSAAVTSSVDLSESVRSQLASASAHTEEHVAKIVSRQSAVIIAAFTEASSSIASTTSQAAAAAVATAVAKQAKNTTPTAAPSTQASADSALLASLSSSLATLTSRQVEAQSTLGDLLELSRAAAEAQTKATAASTKAAAAAATTAAAAASKTTPVNEEVARCERRIRELEVALEEERSVTASLAQAAAAHAQAALTSSAAASKSSSTTSSTTVAPSSSSSLSTSDTASLLAGATSAHTASHSVRAIDARLSQLVVLVGAVLALALGVIVFK